MTLLRVIILAIVQGLAELLPVSSSAHVIVAEKLMGLDPSAPEMTLLLVMLHTGTMFAVIVYFWPRWRRAFFDSMADFKPFVSALILATVLTGIVGGGLVEAIEKLAFRHSAHAWIEQWFSRLSLIAPALAAAGILILWASWHERRALLDEANPTPISSRQAAWIGAIQGLCLPFRGFSRSGATISTGMITGATKRRAEDFSFALAVVITPPAIAREMWRLVKMQHIHSGTVLASAVTPSVLGLFFAFIAGLVALKWLSSWLENGKWYIFGIYCLLAAGGLVVLHHFGY
ncbi:MAG TPA: undecaprenyl-diphosphate phosphatase [Candidatus Acidoferrales bacterium]|nr:undecaprenyl-diphosphate phosphatase [Candidatus Acidoferrales bacterium]